MFPCASCGLCCQNISQIIELKYFDLGDGICKNYNRQNNTCKIYESRPDICKVDVMFENIYYKYYKKE
ncbi:YkgJ family cysteine cluster protein [Aliarcobacter butzleri]|uniref:YkgJ family cysteine cluster protein n=1 Tax=Aliarcobacter butzleri TaxID=28197 RepID=UPI0021B17574|nr:YkgJ family cysteine cluster protein [Aliarcobacter butzleri]MCT7562356.1 YkgJ family cysteine cluster protein [Aliarcobacter butzleri]